MMGLAFFGIMLQLLNLGPQTDNMQTEKVGEADARPDRSAEPRS